MAKALINSQILYWARNRIGLDEKSLAKKINIVDYQKITLWENGEEYPSFIQAKKLANALHIPFGYFYLNEIPREELPIPDLRTVGDMQNNELSLDVYDLIDQIQFKQDWYKDYLIGQGSDPLEFAGKYNINTPVDIIAQDIIEKLDLTIEHRNSVYNREGFLRLLIDKSENIGLWVMRSGIVGNNTHRSLSVKEFRGFTIFDKVAPIVFINGKDAKAAQIFTLIHELAHIWIGESGISDISLDIPIENLHGRIEKLCNSVAAEVLVPKDIFTQKWDAIENINQLALFFQVSNVVVARRAFDLGFMQWGDFLAFYETEKERWAQLEKKKKPGGNYNYTLPIRYGQHFTSSLLRAAINGQIMLRDAGKLLGTKPSKIFKLARELGVA